MTERRFTKSTAAIAAWNLSTFESLDDARIRRQATGLRLLDAELVALVEVRDEGHLQSLVAHLADDGLDYGYTFLAQHEPEGRRRALHIGLLHKGGVRIDAPRLLEGSDLGDRNFRRAFLCDFSIGRLDGHLIAVHLKSGRGSTEQALRDRQCRVIGRYIAELRGPTNRNPDVLLVGDFNMIPGQDISNFHHLGGDDVMDFISSWDLQERFSHILPSGRENLLDGFAIARRYATEYVRGSLRLFPMHWSLGLGQSRYREDVSDHLPFVASFDITRARTD